MKSTGITRRIDHLGRIVLPKELCRTMHIKEKDALEIYVDGDRIILQKYNPGCVSCGGVDNLAKDMGITLCRDCITVLYESFAQGDGAGCEEVHEAT